MDKTRVICVSLGCALFVMMCVVGGQGDESDLQIKVPTVKITLTPDKLSVGHTVEAVVRVSNIPAGGCNCTVFNPDIQWDADAASFTLHNSRTARVKGVVAPEKCTKEVTESTTDVTCATIPDENTDSVEFDDSTFDRITPGHVFELQTRATTIIKEQHEETELIVALKSKIADDVDVEEVEFTIDVDGATFDYNINTNFEVPVNVTSLDDDMHTLTPTSVSCRLFNQKSRAVCAYPEAYRFESNSRRRFSLFLKHDPTATGGSINTTVEGALGVANKCVMAFYSSPLDFPDISITPTPSAVVAGHAFAVTAALKAVNLTHNINCTVDLPATFQFIDYAARNCTKASETTYYCPNSIFNRTNEASLKVFAEAATAAKKYPIHILCVDQSRNDTQTKLEKSADVTITTESTVTLNTSVHVVKNLSKTGLVFRVDGELANLGPSDSALIQCNITTEPENTGLQVVSAMIILPQGTAKSVDCNSTTHCNVPALAGLSVDNKPTKPTIVRALLDITNWNKTIISFVGYQCSIAGKTDLLTSHINATTFADVQPEEEEQEKPILVPDDHFWKYTIVVVILLLIAAVILGGMWYRNKMTARNVEATQRMDKYLEMQRIPSSGNINSRDSFSDVGKDE